jgi:hypothetical protein
MRLRPHIPVPRAASLRHPRKNPGRTQEGPKKNPGRTQEEPTRTRHPAHPPQVIREAVRSVSQSLKNSHPEVSWPRIAALSFIPGPFTPPFASISFTINTPTRNRRNQGLNYERELQ